MKKEKEKYGLKLIDSNLHSRTISKLMTLHLARSNFTTFTTSPLNFSYHFTAIMFTLLLCCRIINKTIFCLVARWKKGRQRLWIRQHLSAFEKASRERAESRECENKQKKSCFDRRYELMCLSSFNTLSLSLWWARKDNQLSSF